MMTSTETSAEEIIATCSAEFGIMIEPGVLHERRVDQTDDRDERARASARRSW